MTRDELIAALEKATGPSDRLDAHIAALITPDARVSNARPWCIAVNGGIRAARAYTSSIDAALTLRPDGAEYTISTLYGVADVEMPLNFGDRPPETARRADGNVPLALCIAALKARA